MRLVLTAVVVSLVGAVMLAGVAQAGHRDPLPHGPTLEEKLAKLGPGWMTCDGDLKCTALTAAEATAAEGKGTKVYARQSVGGLTQAHIDAATPFFRPTDLICDARLHCAPIGDAPPKLPHGSNTVAWYAAQGEGNERATIPLQRSGSPCAMAVLEDWVADSTIDGQYPPWCLRRAIRRAPKDVLEFTSFKNDVRRVLRATMPDVSVVSVRALPNDLTLAVRADANVITLSSDLRIQVIVRNKGPEAMRNVGVRLQLQQGRGQGRSIADKHRTIKRMAPGEWKAVKFWSLPGDVDVATPMTLTALAIPAEGERARGNNRRDYNVIFALDQ